MLPNVPFFFKKKNLGDNDLGPGPKSSLANGNSFGDKGELPWNPRPEIQF
jgi:hypothetical protein